MKVELVTTLKRQATRILKEVQETKEPVLITEHGLPGAYIVDVESFEATEKRLKLYQGLARGEAALRQGRIVEHKTAKQKLAKWLK